MRFEILISLSLSLSFSLFLLIQIPQVSSMSRGYREGEGGQKRGGGKNPGKQTASFPPSLNLFHGEELCP